MFAFAIWDDEQKLLFLARDPLGKKPLKYYRDNNCFIFASELKAILTNKEVKKEPDWSAIDEYLTYKYVPAPKTGFKNIFKLPPASFMVIKSNGETTIKKYWQLDFSKKLNLSEEEWQKKIKDKLVESIKLRLTSDVPLGVHLSSGVDSGLIAALIAKDIGIRPKTFTIGFKEAEYDERPLAKLVAKKYHTNHQELVIEPHTVEILPQLAYQYEEPYADSSALPTFYLSQLTKGYASVAINGDGGDENFAGYERYRAFRMRRLLKIIPAKKILSSISSLEYQRTKNKSYQKIARLLEAYSRNPHDFYLNIIQYFSPTDKQLLYEKKLRNNEASRWRSHSLDLFNEANNLDWLDRLLYVGIKSHLPDDLLVKTDIASMAHGLELRSPFLDKEFMELTAQMPSGLKMRGDNKKYLLKKIAAQYLPAKAVSQTKKYFDVPLDCWFRGDLKKYIEDNIASPKFLDYGFNKNFILLLIREHASHRKNHDNKLWSLLMLRLWFKQWFE
ncbi:MAG: Asparagine synthetase (glutamine-hydrolyzing) 1 [Parcubacteria group bacterium ADurb.Bin316]|nr:MAG: Asparagine synthetase (glutamine-hydrolyzing) 1 [Parcubacteria group bacterium ADurb.Bin316]